MNPHDDEEEEEGGRGLNEEEEDEDDEEEEEDYSFSTVPSFASLNDDDDDDDDDLMDHSPPPPPLPGKKQILTEALLSHPGPGMIFGPTISKKKPGIVYLSSIPPGFNVSQTTQFFNNYGKVGRVFLQPDTKGKNSGKSGPKTGLTFTEGWIEFISKRVAQDVAQNLNTTPVGGKKRSKAHDVLWNIKYLPRFKWSHLTERLNYEKAVHHQKMRNEIVQAKREADYFKSNVEKSKRMKKNKSATTPSTRPYEFRQKETDESIRTSKRKRTSSSNNANNTTDTIPSANKKAKKSNTTNKMTKNKGKGKKSSLSNNKSGELIGLR